MPKRVFCDRCPLLVEEYTYYCSLNFKVFVLEERHFDKDLGGIVDSVLASDNCELESVNFKSKVFTPQLREEHHGEGVTG